ncbi:hypothetical protein QF035_008973 [Streptomyces umbrinus]|uniref:Uncharacterized protein n=1 Tax=Streptomyces umbrinus TaxID=67370 RepID=A0ABU0T8U2_9ACTN|nr:hypothetical protein [Streptomyces umbrinus]MDQ1031391.1 hypothetical protein [Streptomyces umbrinus]
MTAVAWLERHYDGLFAEGRDIVMPTDSNMIGLKVTSYAPDPVGERYDHGPLSPSSATPSTTSTRGLRQRHGRTRSRKTTSTTTKAVTVMVTD